MSNIYNIKLVSSLDGMFNDKEGDTLVIDEDGLLGEES